MSRVIIIISILFILAILTLVVGSKFGMKIGELNMTANKDKQILAELAINFLEDIKFKDFKKAASYHYKTDRDKVNIPQLIEEKFMIKPEFLDITKYEVKEVDLDRSGNRARVKTRTIFKVLNTSEIKEMDMIFYFHKKEDGIWYMMLESSLRM